MDERLASSAQNARERAHLKALQKIADNLERIADVMQMDSAVRRGECDPFESPAFLAMNRSGELVVVDEKEE